MYVSFFIQKESSLEYRLSLLGDPQSRAKLLRLCLVSVLVILKSSLAGFRCKAAGLCVTDGSVEVSLAVLGLSVSPVIFSVNYCSLDV